MSKTIKTVSLAVVALVVVYLGYQLLERWMNPCEGVFQQSAVGLNTKLDVIKAKGEFAIGRQKIQDLTERSQETALNLKACCIVLGKASGDFLRCKEGFDKYDAEINKLATSVKEAEAAKERGESEIAIEKIAEANEGLKAVDTAAQTFTKHVAQIKEKPPADGRKEKESLSAADCCRIVPNAELKSLGRIVVAFPEGSKAEGTPIGIFKAGDKKSIERGYGVMAADLIPGQYDVEVSGRRVRVVEVRAAHDTKVRVGVLRVRVGSGTPIGIFERGGKDQLTRFYGSSDIGLPVGQYDVEVAGQRAPVTIKEDAITEF